MEIKNSMEINSDNKDYTVIFTNTSNSKNNLYVVEVLDKLSDNGIFYRKKCELVLSICDMTDTACCAEDDKIVIYDPKTKLECAYKNCSINEALAKFIIYYLDLKFIKD